MCPHELENGLIAEFVLFVSLNGEGSLESQGPHGSLHVHRSLLQVLINTVVYDTKSATAANTSAAVNNNLVVTGVFV